MSLDKHEWLSFDVEQTEASISKEMLNKAAAQARRDAIMECAQLAHEHFMEVKHGSGRFDGEDDYQDQIDMHVWSALQKLRDEIKAKASVP